MAQGAGLVEVGRGSGRGGDGFAAGASAARDALAGLSTLAPSALLVFGSVRYSLDRVLRGVASVAPEVPVIGASTAGELCDGVAAETVVVTALASPHLELQSGLGRGVSRDWRAALDEALAAAELAPWFDGSPDPWDRLVRQGRSAFALLFTPGPTRLAPGHAAELLQGLRARCGDRLQVLGAAAGDDGRQEESFVLRGLEAEPDGVLVAVVETRLRFGLALAHGLKPTAARATVTEADGAEVRALDHRAAADALASMGGLPGAAPGGHATTPAGVLLGSLEPGGAWLPNPVAAVTARRGLRLARPAAPGTVLARLAPDGDPAAAAARVLSHVARQRGGLTAPAAALVFACAGRARVLGEAARGEPAALSALLGGVPVVGFLSPCQIGPSEEGEPTATAGVLAALVLGDELSEAARVAEQGERLRKEVEEWFLALGQSNAALMQANAALRTEVEERRRVEAGLLEARGRLRALLDSVGDMAWLKDAEGRYVAANEPLARAAGLEVEALVGKTDAEIWPAALAEKYRRDDLKVMEGATILQVEEPLVDCGGVRSWVETYKVPVLDPGGRVSGVAGVARDVTKRRDVEALRWSAHQDLEQRVQERTAELERANRSLQAELARRAAFEAERRSLEKQLRQAQKMDAMGRLAGGVAHDFNNILTVILSAASALRQDPQDAVDLADEIHLAGERAAALTRQLLAFSRQQAVEPRPVDADELVRGFLKMLGRLLGANIKLEVRLEARGRVFADAGQLEQVLLNLAVNARDAMPGGGQIRVSTDRPVPDEPEVVRNAPVRGEWIRLTVSDTGAGMDDEVLQRIFEPFFTTKEKGKGTGLGLATVFGIVRQAGGFITVESAVGRGSAFRVYLPRLAEAGEARQAEAPTAAAAPGAGEVVLLAEDDADVREQVARTLRNGGYRVLQAGSAEEAVLRFEEAGGEVDLLLSDVLMASEDGPALARRLCARRPGLRVLFTTGHSGGSPAVDEAAASGALFRKPFTTPGLLGAVRAALDAGPG